MAIVDQGSTGNWHGTLSSHILIHWNIKLIYMLTIPVLKWDDSIQVNIQHACKLLYKFRVIGRIHSNMISSFISSNTRQSHLITVHFCSPRLTYFDQPFHPKKGLKLKLKFPFCKMLKKKYFHVKVLGKRFHVNSHTAGFVSTDSTVRISTLLDSIIHTGSKRVPKVKTDNTTRGKRIASCNSG